jgi:hypothetical protein
MIRSGTMLPTTLGELRRAVAAGDVPRRPVRAELRDNLILKLRAGDDIFPGIVGYDDTVVPQVVNAVLSQAQLHPAGPARPGQDAAAARADDACSMRRCPWCRV